MDTLHLVTSLPLSPKDIRAWRGAFAQFMALEPHGRKSGYPLLQFRTHWLQGQSYAALFAINEAIATVEAFAKKMETTAFDIMGQTYKDLRVLERNQVYNYLPRILENGTIQLYRIKRYVPLNNSVQKNDTKTANNEQEYLAIEAAADKVLYIEKLLNNHVVSFLSAFNLKPTLQVDVKIVDIEKVWQDHLYYPHKNFELLVRANLALPNFVSIGNLRAFDRGIVTLA